MTGRIIRNLLIYVLIVNGCVGLLALVSMIPTAAIRGNVEKSCEYFESREDFDAVTRDAFGTRQDNYADAILVNIAYNLNEGGLMDRIMGCYYYNDVNSKSADNLRLSLKNDNAVNESYSRYWHGSLLIVRPLLTLVDIQGIRLIYLLAVLTLSSIFMYQLIKNKHVLLAVCYLISMVLVKFWMVGFCIEYANVFLIMSVANIIIIHMNNEDMDKMVTLFMVLGLVTAYMDFLTTETMVFTIPYFIYFAIKYEKEKMLNIRKEFKKMVDLGLTFISAYSVMYAVKWGMASLILGKQEMDTALAKASARINGTATLGNMPGQENVNTAERIVRGCIRNVACLFGWENQLSTGSAMLMVLTALGIMFALWYLFRGRKGERNFLLMCAVISMIPFARFIVLNNHSYIHFFFTYRAIAVTLLALLYYVGHTMFEFDGTRIKKARK